MLGLKFKIQISEKDPWRNGNLLLGTKQLIYTVSTL